MQLLSLAIVIIFVIYVVNKIAKKKNGLSLFLSKSAIGFVIGIIVVYILYTFYDLVSLKAALEIDEKLKFKDFVKVALSHLINIATLLGLYSILLVNRTEFTKEEQQQQVTDNLEKQVAYWKEESRLKSKIIALRDKKLEHVREFLK